MNYRELLEENRKLKEVLLAALPALKHAEKNTQEFDINLYGKVNPKFILKDRYGEYLFNWRIYKEALKLLNLEVNNHL